jgi:peptidyl-prolyl cis-trans isomerase A (cyclophilin A)
MKNLLLALLLSACAASAASPGEPPDPAKATLTAPAVFKAKLVTTRGDIVVEVHRDWAANGADRFYNLVKLGFFTDIAVFRVIKGFMAQFGVHGDPAVSAKWREAQIADDPAKVQSNTRGRLTFATAGPNTRTTQLFISYGDNSSLDEMGFAPIGEVVTGMDVVDAWEGKYGEGQPRGKGPAQGRLQKEGNTYLRADYPGLDYIKRAEIL